MSRTLASIQRIIALDPIPGADKILHAQVLGWKCITAIDNGFKVGDLVVYIEIDSRVPAIPEFAFLEKRGYKVKTMKFNKFNVISQGLIIPLSVIKNLVTSPIELAEGIDVTDILKVTKIDTDEPGERAPCKKQHPVDAWLCNRFRLYRQYIRPFIYRKEDRGWPKGIPHTDETRIQALWGKLEPIFNTNKKWYITTKIDGQSATYYYKKKWFSEFFGLYSREIRKKEGDGSNWAQMAEKYKIKNMLKRACKAYKVKSIWIQGEIAGPSIQGNKNRFQVKRLFIFNVYVPELKRYLNPTEMFIFCNKFGFEMVPIISNEKSLAGLSIDELVKMSNGPSEWSKDDLREGIVIREMEDYGLNRISFKVISPEFLTKYNL